LAIVGGSDHDTHYARALHQKADPSILLLGKRSRETLASLYQHCRACALPSSHEALAIVALEAASCGAPVLVSDIEANRNFQLPDGHYFPLDDAGALADLLRNLPQGFAAANERLVKLFDWDESARATDALFRDLIREMRGADLRAPESSKIAAR
jgi:glycosyltransferase involved in cell wall biosynthesis